MNVSEIDILRVLLLSVCYGCINAARGSGISGVKPLQVVAMAVGAFSISGHWLDMIFFPLPVLAMFWLGTGELMFLNFYAPKFIKQKDQWRFWEFVLLFLYSFVYLSSLTLTKTL